MQTMLIAGHSNQQRCCQCPPRLSGHINSRAMVSPQHLSSANMLYSSCSNIATKRCGSALPQQTHDAPYASVCCTRTLRHTRWLQLADLLLQASNSVQQQQHNVPPSRAHQYQQQVQQRPPAPWVWYSPSSPQARDLQVCKAPNNQSHIVACQSAADVATQVQASTAWSLAIHLSVDAQKSTKQLGGGGS